LLFTNICQGYSGNRRYPNASSIEPKKGLAMKMLFARFMQDESGATAIEYALIAAGVSVAIITVVGTLGTKLNTTYTAVQTGLK
jgi:pilus assembly protein Flp/PilA